MAQVNRNDMNVFSCEPSLKEPLSKRRKGRLSRTETEMLVQNIVCNYNDLYSNEAVGHNPDRQQQLWSKIQKKVNGIGCYPHSLRDMKQKWSDLCLDVKRKISAAGAGKSNQDPVLSQLEMLVASTLTDFDFEEAVAQGTRASERTPFEPSTPEPGGHSCLYPPGVGMEDSQDRFSHCRPTIRLCQLHPCVSSSPETLQKLHSSMTMNPEKEEGSNYNLYTPEGMSTSTEISLSVDDYCKNVGWESCASSWQFSPVQESSDGIMEKRQIPSLGNAVNKAHVFPLSYAVSEDGAELCETLQEPCSLVSPLLSEKTYDDVGLTIERIADLHMQRRLIQQRKMAIQHEQMVEKTKCYTSMISMLTDIRDVLEQCRELGWGQETPEQCREVGKTSQHTHLERPASKVPTLRMGLRSHTRAHAAEMLTRSTISQIPNYSEQTVRVQENETRLNVETLDFQCDARTLPHRGRRQSSTLSRRPIHRPELKPAGVWT